MQTFDYTKSVGGQKHIVCGLSVKEEAYQIRTEDEFWKFDNYWSIE